MKNPLVSIICLCYNHSRFVEESIHSVLNQTYQNIEIIIYDDASTDDSWDRIQAFADVPRVKRLMQSTTNLGNCVAFNRALKETSGQYIIDLSTDDVLLPDRVNKQVDFFSKQPENVGVIFSNVSFISESGKFLGNHFLTDKHGMCKQEVPEGEVFSELIRHYFVSPPSMMIKADVMKKLNGYDEALAYEDFDFWVRSSRYFSYSYQDELLTKVRKSKHSLSSKWYIPGDPQLHSTYLVCLKAVDLVKNKAEKEALIQRLRYEIRQSVFSQNFKEASNFISLYKSLSELSLAYRFLEMVNRNKINLSWMRDIYRRVRY